MTRALEGETPRDRYDGIAEAIRSDGDYRWVGVYVVDGDEIAALGWSGAGEPAHPRFPVDRGLCGAAVTSGRPIVSNDVHADPRYLTTFGSTRSELVVPIGGHGTPVVGLIDVESGDLDAFTDDDVARVRRWAIAVLEKWPI